MEEKEVATGTIEHRLSMPVRKPARKPKVEKNLPKPEKRRKPGKTRKRKTAESVIRNLDAMLKTIVFLSIIGSLISLYLTWLFYSPSQNGLCAGCKEIAMNPYSFVLGIPLGIVSALGFVSIMLTGLSIYKGYDWTWLSKGIKSRHCSIVLISLAGIGTLAAAWFTIVQAVILRTWCLMCVLAAVLMVMVFILSFTSLIYCRKSRRALQMRGVEQQKLCRYC